MGRFIKIESKYSPQAAADMRHAVFFTLHEMVPAIPQIEGDNDRCLYSVSETMQCSVLAWLQADPPLMFSISEGRSIELEGTSGIPLRRGESRLRRFLANVRISVLLSRVKFPLIEKKLSILEYKSDQKQENRLSIGTASQSTSDIGHHH